jgi:hypothetical protein
MAKKQTLAADVSRTGRVWRAVKTTRCGTRRGRLGRSKPAVKKAVKKFGSSRKHVERSLGR